MTTLQLNRESRILRGSLKKKASNLKTTINTAMTEKPRPLVDLLLSIVIPSIVLMKFSGENDLGATGALIVALAFPITVGLYQLVRYRITNYIALLGLVSVLLTGGIGLLQLDTQWLAVKEAAIPAVLGCAVLISARLRYPLLRKLLYNPSILDTEKISRILDKRGYQETFDARLLGATYALSGTFLFSAVMKTTCWLNGLLPAQPAARLSTGNWGS